VWSTEPTKGAAHGYGRCFTFLRIGESRPGFTAGPLHPNFRTGFNGYAGKAKSLPLGKNSPHYIAGPRRYE